MSASTARAFELWALKTIENNPTAEWEAISSLWNNLQQTELHTRERIVRRMHELAAMRGDALPAPAVKLYVADAKPLPPAKELPRNIALFRAAAEYSVGRKDWMRAFAKEHGIPDSTVRQWQEKHPHEFKLAAMNPTLPHDQIFSPVMWEHVSLVAELPGKIVGDAHVVKAADVPLASEDKIADVADEQVVEASAQKKP